MKPIPTQVAKSKCQRPRENPNTSVVLKEHTDKMTPKDILLVP